MANRPPNRGFNVYGTPDQAGQPGPTLDQHAHRAAQLGGNVLRLPFDWGTFQLANAQGYNYAKLDRIRGHVQAARAANPTVKALLIISGPAPGWVQSQFPNQIVNNGFNPRADPSTGAADALGYLGLAAAQALIYLAGYADVVELYNEPNSSGGVAPPLPPLPPIDPIQYGDMAAFAAFWIWNCVVTGNPVHNPNAHLAAGALSTGSGDAYNYQTYLPQFLEQTCTRLVSLTPEGFSPIWNDIRISFHPYPVMDQTDVGLAVQRVKDKTNNVINLAGVNRRYWATEVSASSRPTAQGGLGGEGQKDFARDVSTWMGGKSQIEGMLWWPFSDWDPRAIDPDDPGGFYLTGVIRQDNTNKNAANWFQGNWP